MSSIFGCSALNVQRLSGLPAVRAAPLTHPALLVQQIKQAQLTLDKSDALLIVTEGDGVPGQLLLNVLLLLQLEHMLEGKKQTP